MSDEQSNDGPKLSFKPTAPVTLEESKPVNAPPAKTELEVLKERADVMGIEYAVNIGVDALKAKIIAKQEEPSKPVKLADPEDEEFNHMPMNSSKARREQIKAEQEASMKTSKTETVQQIRDRLKKDAMKLVRCRVYNMNPSKADLKGELVTVGNKYLGTVRKFIPFGEATDNGFHMEQILFDELRQRKFQQLRPKKVRGIEVAPERRMVPEYNLEVLPQLTRAELKQLGEKQAAAERLGTDTDL